MNLSEQKKHTHVANTLSATEYKSQYDEAAKELLADKQILSRILKFLVVELQEYDVTFIMSCIDGEPQVSKLPVFPSLPDYEKITGMNTESTILGEGTVTFDIRFNVIIPRKERLKIIINIEAQREYYAGYSFESRGIFYCARMISEQKDTEFKGENYDDIKKVYSIWICMNPSHEDANTITEYSLCKHDIYGKFCSKKLYDLLSVVIIRLNRKSNVNNTHKLIHMLDVAFSPQMEAKEKIRILESEYDIIMEDKLEGGIQKMSKDIWWFEEELTEKITKSVTESVTKSVTIEKMIESVENIMESFGVTLERACIAMKTTVEAYERAKLSLEKR